MVLIRTKELIKKLLLINEFANNMCYASLSNHITATTTVVSVTQEMEMNKKKIR